MKVLLINSVCGIRSTGRVCTDLADVLAANGHDCKIALGRESVPEKYKRYAVRIGYDMDVKLHALRSRIFDDTGFGSKQATKKFIEWVKIYDPDIIHLHNIHGYYINIEILFNYLKTYKKKVIWTLHDCWSFTGHCTHFDYIGCNKWKTECQHCLQLKEYPASIGMDHSQANYRKKRELFTGIANMTLVTPSEWLSGMVKQSFLHDYPIKVINNGIDLMVFKPTQGGLREKYGLQDKRIILGVASVWDKRKGLDDFLKLSTLLDNHFKIVLVGLNDKQLQNLPANILGIARTNCTKDLAEIYTAADVFVNPTYEDNYPTTNLEAQACGTPVITYHTGGSVESVSEKTGVIVPRGNIKVLLEAITSDRRFSSINGREFDKSEKYSKYLKLYLGSENETSIYDQRTVSV